MSSIGEIIGRRPDKKLYKEDPTLVSNDHAVGVELELENIRYFRREEKYPDIFQFWNAIEDGSLRQGTEFIFSEPYKAANITRALEVMDEFLKVYKFNGKPVNISDRCSVHVHLDVRDMTSEDLNNLVLVYMFFERVLFKVVGQYRSKNNYCRPLTDSSFLNTLIRMLKYSAIEKLANFITLVRQECDKYSALNVLPIQNYGSVEFRHHPGTTNMSSVKDWINIILAIKNISKTYKITDIVNMFNKDGVDYTLITLFSGTVLGDPKYISDTAEIPLLMLKGYNDIKEVLDFDKLQKETSKRALSKVKFENSLMYQYLKKNDLLHLAPQPKIKTFPPLSATTSSTTSPTTFWQAS